MEDDAITAYLREAFDRLARAIDGLLALSS
jgi:hypothetical protein